MFWCLQIVLFVSADVWRYPCERFLHPNQTQGGGGEWKVNTKVKKTFISCLHYLQISLELLSTKKKIVPLKTILWIVTRIMNTFFGNSCCCWFSLYSPPLYWTGGINTWTNKKARLSEWLHITEWDLGETSLELLNLKQFLTKDSSSPFFTGESDKYQLVSFTSGHLILTITLYTITLIALIDYPGNLFSYPRNLKLELDEGNTTMIFISHGLCGF